VVELEGLLVRERFASLLRDVHRKMPQ